MPNQPSNEFKNAKRMGLSSLTLALPLVLLSLLLNTMEGQAKSESVTAGLLTVACVDDCTTDVPVYEQTENLVPNPGFEQEIRPDQWGSRGDCTLKRVCGVGRNGSCAIMLAPYSDGYCDWKVPWRAIAVSEHKYYDFAGWIKTQDLDSGQARIAVKFAYADGQVVDPIPCKTSVEESTDPDWVRVTGRIRAPEDAAHAWVFCSVEGAKDSLVLCDDIFLGSSVNLAVTKDDNPDPVALNGLLAHTLVYSNVGCEMATGVFVKDTLDGYTDYITSTPPSTPPTGGEWCVYASSKRKVICYDPDLGAGERGELTVTVRVKDDTGDRCYLVNQATVESDETLVSASAIEATTIVPCPNGCEVELVDLAPQTPEYFPSSVRYPYLYKVFNAGNHSGTVTLTAQCPLGWPIETQPLTETIPPGDWIDAESTVIVSNDVPSGTSCTWGITAALNCPAVSETVTDTESVTTTAQRVTGVDIFPGSTTKPAQAGTGVTFTHTVTNTGNWTDTLSFECVPASNSVECSAPTPVSVTLAKQESTTMTVVLTDVGCDIFMPAIIEVENLAGAKSSFTDALTAHYTPTLSPGTHKNADAGTTVYFTHTLAVSTNSGNCPGVFTLTAAPLQHDWITTPLLSSITLTGGEEVITVSVDVSPKAPKQVTATLAMTATAHFDPAILTMTTDTLIVPASVAISPGVSKYVLPGETITFTHTITNADNREDTFTLTATSLQTWITPILSSPVTLLPMKSKVITVAVDVSPTATQGNQAIIAVTATSHFSPVKQAITTDTLTVLQDVGVKISPGISKTTLPGKTVLFTHTVTNTGSHEDTFTLTATSSQTWATPTLSPSVTLPPMESKVITVSVDVSPQAIHGDQAAITVTATSHFSPAVQDSSIDHIQVREFRIYLPLLMHNWPLLQPIDNSDGDGNYIVEWTTTTAIQLPIIAYTLEEDQVCGNVHPVEFYTITNTSRAFTNQKAGRYCYRVRARNKWGIDSDWSNQECVEVLWEHTGNEPDEQADGPLCSKTDYIGYPDDVQDWFKFYHNTTGQITVDLRDHSCDNEEEGSQLQLQLQYQQGNNPPKICDDPECFKHSPPYSIEYADAPAGWYYVRLFIPPSASCKNDVTPYTLRTTFSQSQNQRR